MTTRTLTTLAADWDQDQSAHGYGPDYSQNVRRIFDEKLEQARVNLGADNLYREGTAIVLEGKIDGDDFNYDWVEELVSESHDAVIETIESAE